MPYVQLLLLPRRGIETTAADAASVPTCAADATAEQLKAQRDRLAKISKKAAAADTHAADTQSPEAPPTLTLDTLVDARASPGHEGPARKDETAGS